MRRWLTPVLAMVFALGLGCAGDDGDSTPAPDPTYDPSVTEQLPPLNPGTSNWEPLAVADDPLLRMPGTQPMDVQTGGEYDGTDEFEEHFRLDKPDVCFQCHGNSFNRYAEPGFNWTGGMMAQAARDFLYFSCLTVADHDSIWAVNNPNAGDICVRCHFPKGWLEGRSDPTNASRFVDYDYDGVQCDFCHRLMDPFFERTVTNWEEDPETWEAAWDEAMNSWDGAYIEPIEDPQHPENWQPSDTPSATEHGAQATYQMDLALSADFLLFNGGNFYDEETHLPFSSAYVENASGQYFYDWVNKDDKRGPMDDAVPAWHDPQYSRYHKQSYFCSTCHDVSNPVLANLTMGTDADGDGITDDLTDGPLPTEEYPAFSYFHVERTFSEFQLSAYADGAAGEGPFATINEAGTIGSCQDCHMPELWSTDCEEEYAKIRPEDSDVHPNTPTPLHDLTGGNAWVNWVLASAIRDETEQDHLNHDLLIDRADELTMDVMAGTFKYGATEAVDALMAGSDRAKQMLRDAGAIEDLSVDGSTVSFKVKNNTGHKLISGFPEGRRMFVNVRAYDDAGELIYEVNPYDYDAGTLRGLTDVNYYDTHPWVIDALPAPEPLDDSAEYVDALVYEGKPTSFLTGEKKTFHFVLATGMYKDNRIPPKGFDIDQANVRLIVPHWEGEARYDYFTAEEYAGGYDAVTLTLPVSPDHVEVNLYYQTTSREYVEFLRDEINDRGDLPPSPTNPDWDGYIVQTDSYFEGLRAWGDTLWQLWKVNMNEAGAAPVLMTKAAWPSDEETLPAPTGLVASADGWHVDLSWDAVSGAEGYLVQYYQGFVNPDQAFYGTPKLQLIEDVGTGLSYSLSEREAESPQIFCYTVTAYEGDLYSAPATSTDMCVRLPGDEQPPVEPDAPVADATASPNPVQVGNPVTLDGTGSTNADTYAWTLLTQPAGSTAAIVDAASATATLTPDVAGDYVVELTVTNAVGTDTAQVTVTATDTPPAPQAPVASATASPNPVTVGNTVTLDGTGSTGADTYAWAFVSQPSAVTITNATSATATFVPDAAGDYVVELTVTNTAGTDTAQVTVTAQAAAPAFDAAAFYSANCSGCHGADGTGQGGVLTTGNITANLITAQHGTSHNLGTLSATELADLAAWINASFGPAARVVVVY